MAPKKITGYVKLQITGGKATPAPPVGPALGQAQVNIMEFCKQFNARTSTPEMTGMTIPVVITVYADRSFSFITKTPPAAVLLLKAAGIEKGSGTPNKEKKGKVTEKQILAIATQKMPDMNANHGRGCCQEHPRHGPLHGHRSRRLRQSSSRNSAQPSPAARFLLPLSLLRCYVQRLSLHAPGKAKDHDAGPAKISGASSPRSSEPDCSGIIRPC